MKLYLVRHGESLPPEIDPQKGLSPEGKEKIHALGTALKDLHLFQISQVFHSTKARARQTAEILASYLCKEIPLIEQPFLAPNDAVEPFIRSLEGEEGEWMVVSHLPYLSHLVGALVVGEPENELVHFDAGTTVCLIKADGHWEIEWMHQPT